MCRSLIFKTMGLASNDVAIGPSLQSGAMRDGPFVVCIYIYIYMVPPPSCLLFLGEVNEVFRVQG